MSARTQLRDVPLGWALLALLVAVAALLVKALGLLALVGVVLADRLIAAAIAGADYADERTTARAGLSDPLSRLGFATMGGGRR